MMNIHRMIAIVINIFDENEEMAAWNWACNSATNWTQTLMGNRFASVIGAEYSSIFFWREHASNRWILSKWGVDRDERMICFLLFCLSIHYVCIEFHNIILNFCFAMLLQIYQNRTKFKLIKVYYNSNKVCSSHYYYSLDDKMLITASHFISFHFSYVFFSSFFVHRSKRFTKCEYNERCNTHIHTLIN